MLSRVAIIAALLITACSYASATEITAQRQAELRYLLKHDCGSCHGMRLQGGLGPALTATRLAPYETEFLALTILQGRPGTPMPPWYPFLSEQEAHWLGQQLKQGAGE